MPAKELYKTIQDMQKDSETMEYLKLYEKYNHLTSDDYFMLYRDLTLEIKTKEQVSKQYHMPAYEIYLKEEFMTQQVVTFLKSGLFLMTLKLFKKGYTPKYIEVEDIPESNQMVVFTKGK